MLAVGGQVRTGRAATVEMQFDLRRADEEREMLTAATKALMSAKVGGKAGQLAVDQSGRQMIGISGRRMAHRMPAAIEVALETLEGSMMVMRRAKQDEAARAAAAAIEALREPSDVLASWQLGARPAPRTHRRLRSY